MIRSIRWRLVLAGAQALALALALSGMGLAVLFERHVERVAVADLQDRALALAAMVQPAGTRLRAPPDDPLYDQPFSGHYWQVELGE
ncbi:sensor histidine kinase, partial [Paracoccus sp. PXZ]